MKSTVDTYTGKPFRYNEITTVSMRDGRRIRTVCRLTSRTNVWLHPDRLTPAMFTTLNPVVAP